MPTFAKRHQPTVIKTRTKNSKSDQTATERARFGHDLSQIARASAEMGEGRSIPQKLKRRLEKTTGKNLGGVRIHTGSESQKTAQQLNARAYTIGNDIHFARGQYHPGKREGDRLIAHELVHTIQQGPAQTAQTKLEVSKPQDAAEVEADRVADAIIGGRGVVKDPMPMRVSAARKAISRAEFKNGDATFKLDPYSEVDPDNGNDTARQVGVNLDITYSSAETYRSDKIGFIQTMKTTKDNKPYLFANEKPRATTVKEGEAGWAIDRLSGKKSPIYAQENTGSAGGNTIFGYRKSKADAKDAWMHDKLGLNRAVGQKVTVDAVTYAFDETNSKYLGGISWGFATDTKGKTAKKAAALHSAGDPSGIQKEALKKWNEQAALADLSKRNAPNQANVVVP